MPQFDKSTSMYIGARVPEDVLDKLEALMVKDGYKLRNVRRGQLVRYAIGKAVGLPVDFEHSREFVRPQQYDARK